MYMYIDIYIVRVF